MLDRAPNEYARVHRESRHLAFLRREAPITCLISLLIFLASLWVHVPSLTFALMAIIQGVVSYAAWSVGKVRDEMPWLFPLTLLITVPIGVLNANAPKHMITLQGLSLACASMSLAFVADRYCKRRES